MEGEEDAVAVALDLRNDEWEQELVARFRAGLPARVAAVEDASRAGDFPALKRLLHTLRGASACFGFPAIATAAAVAERAAGAYDGDAVRAGVRALAELCERAWVIVG